MRRSSSLDLTCQGRRGNRRLRSTRERAREALRRTPRAGGRRDARARARRGCDRGRRLARSSRSATSPPGSSTRATRRTSSAPRRRGRGDEIAVIPPVSGGDFRLSADPLSGDAAVAEVRDDGAGAIATFIGTTRAHSRGREVLHLEYEAYEGMAEQVMEELASRLSDRHELTQGRDPPSRRPRRHRRDERRHRRVGAAPGGRARRLPRGDRRIEGLRPALEEGDVRGR